MKKLILLASLAASGMFAACRHEAPPRQPAPRELPPMGPRPRRVDPAPIPLGVPSANPGASAMLADRQRMRREDRDPAIGDGDEVAQPSSVKPDGGILYDAGTPLPPVPDGGPLPGVRDAGQPMSQ